MTAYLYYFVGMFIATLLPYSDFCMYWYLAYICEGTSVIRHSNISVPVGSGRYIRRDVEFILIMGDKSKETRELCWREGVVKIPYFSFIAGTISRPSMAFSFEDCTEAL